MSRNERTENDTLGTLHSSRDLEASEELPEGVNKDLARCVRRCA